MRLPAVVLAGVLLWSACGGGEQSMVRGPAEDRPALADYANDVDAIAVQYPSDWHLAKGPLAAGLVGDDVEILGLTTSLPPAAVDPCSPYPWAAMKALSPGDAVFSLRMSMGTVDRGGFEPFPPPTRRPAALFGETPAEAELPGGCAVAGVDTYQWTFLEHNRPYSVMVGAALPLGDQRRSELEQVWASLDLRPVAQPPATGAVIGQDYFHVMSTHCGVEFDRFDGREWQADPGLDTGTGNPPPGWGNPLTAGVMVRLGPNQARFTVRHTDLTADFRIRRADDPPFYCA